MKSPTFWLLLVGMLVAWRVMAGLNEESDAGNQVLRTEFDFSVLYSRKPVLVVFSANWCGACKKIAPVFKRLAISVDKRAMIYHVDVEQQPEVAKRFGVTSLPTLLIFNNGEAVERVRTADESAILERLLFHAEKSTKR